MSSQQREKRQVSDVPTAWMIRAGSHGEDEDSVLESGLAVVGFREIPDLTEATTREQLKKIVSDARPGAKARQVANFAGQLWALRARVTPGDLVVLPLKKDPQIALGIVTDGYGYREDENSVARHCIRVDWKRTDVPRTAVRQDLLHSLGAFMTVCQIKRNDGAWRLQQILHAGIDPGERTEAVEAVEAGESDDVDSPESSFDLERIVRDQIQAFVAEQFAGHGLSDLVAAVLRAEGFFTEVSSRGPDGGIDVFAGRGPLGLDSPKLIVQVKSSPTPVDVKIVRELHGVLTTHGADQALLVAWGGPNKVATQELRGQFFRVRVWDADDLVDAVLRNYDRLDEGTRAALPLKRIWSLVAEPAAHL